MLSDLYTILLTDESEVFANLKDKIFQISYNRFLQIPFRYCFRHLKEIKHIIIKKNVASCSSGFFDSRCQRFLRQHISFIISTVNLTFQFSFWKPLFNTHIHVKNTFVHTFTRRHDFEMVRPAQLCHQWWHFFIVLVKFVKLLHSVKSTTIKSFQFRIIRCKEISQFLHKCITIFSIFRLHANIFAYITVH